MKSPLQQQARENRKYLPERRIAPILILAAILAGLGRPAPAGGGTAAPQSPAAPAKAPDPWAPFRYFVGRWQGRGESPAGPFSGKMEFQLVLGGTFLQVKGEARVEPKAGAPKGAAAEDIAFFGYDTVRKAYTLRQFRSDGSVGLFHCRKVLDDGKTFIFVNRPEYGPPGGPRMKMTYRISGPQEFGLTVETAEPDKDYVRSTAAVFKRMR